MDNMTLKDARGMLNLAIRTTLINVSNGMDSPHSIAIAARAATQLDRIDEVIGAHMSQHAAMKQAHAELLQSYRDVVEQHAAMVAKLHKVIKEMRDVATFNHAKANDFKNLWADELDGAIGDRT